MLNSVRAVVALLALALTVSGYSGCLERPVEPVEPGTTNVFVNVLPQSGVDKIDLLFVIDNSVSMADKQAILGRAVPALLQRFVNPVCVDADGNRRAPPADAAAPCADAGFRRQFPPITDINVAVISSSLGAAGADRCVADAENDRAHVIGSVRPGLSSWDGTGFLAWDPEAKRTPQGIADAAELGAVFTDHVDAVGENGCGYEASLESWYRFLVEPDPYLEIVRVPCDEADDKLQCAEARGTDQALLDQRARFLRPDSLVAVIVLSDENDCSIRADRQSHLLTDTRYTRPRARSECATNPNDPCCSSCGLPAPAGCPPNEDDPQCQLGDYACANGFCPEDPANLRCFHQRRRYGYDFLYPLQRYVDGLSKQNITDRFGNAADHPLFAGRRSPGNVFLAGIVGVPWQDVASKQSLSDAARLDYLSASQLAAPDNALGGKSRWDLILGTRVDAENPTAPPVPPLDPHMVESIDPRSGTNPLTGSALAPTTAGPGADPISGHERDIPDRDDLQFACTFQLAQPRDCTTEPRACDCESSAELASSPLCQGADGGYSTTQVAAKAFPSTRQLEVLRGLGDTGIVASICPKQPVDTASPIYGYGPAMEAIADRLAQRLGGQCLPRKLEVFPDGDVPCAVVETFPKPAEGCDCSAPGRAEVEAQLAAGVRKRLRSEGQCDGDTGRSCEIDVCLCALRFAGDPAVGGSEAQLAECLNDEDVSPETYGYCYIDSDRGECDTDADCGGERLRCDGGRCRIGNAQLVQGCDADKRRLLRIAGEDTPRSGSTTLFACLGAAL